MGWHLAIKGPVYEIFQIYWKIGKILRVWKTFHFMITNELKSDSVEMGLNEKYDWLQMTLANRLHREKFVINYIHF